MAFYGDNAVAVWINYEGDTNSVKDSFNVSSLTDISAGKHTVNFSVTMSNDDFVVVHNQRLETSGGAPNVVHTGCEQEDHTTTSCKIVCGTGNQNAASSSGSSEDSQSVMVAVIGDF
tara:strand:- start:171 stop:521 length:351 start_codon:yes stop_codon:yes gene_type:complete